MSQPLSNFQMRDAEALLHPYTDPVALRETGALVIERGEGVRVFDQAGRGYIDGLAGLWCCGLGFGNDELVEAARAQMAKLPYYHLFAARSHEPAVELAERIKELAPGRMARVFYQSSGSEANETQVKFAWYFNNALGRPAKKKIISRVKGYHGVTIVAASLTGLPNNHRDFDLPVAGDPAHGDAALLEGRRGRRERGRLRAPARRRARGADRGRGARDRRRLHRRAGDGRGRRHRAARGLLPRDRRGLPPARRPDDLRRGDLRLRADRAVVRRRDARLSGERALDGEAADRRASCRSRPSRSTRGWPR